MHMMGRLESTNSTYHDQYIVGLFNLWDLMGLSFIKLLISSIRNEINLVSYFR